MFHSFDSLPEGTKPEKDRTGIYHDAMTKKSLVFRGNSTLQHGCQKILVSVQHIYDY